MLCVRERKGWLDTDMTICLENITKVYDGNTVLDHVNANIEWGRCYVVTGEKGCGKSTFLKIFMGTVRPDGGAVRRMGDYKYPTLQSAYVTQDGQLNPKKNSLWNVCKAHRKVAKGRAAEELALFLTPEQIVAPTGNLTPVQRRFAEIVRACVMPADFLVMDEPFYGMSPEERKKALDYILEVRGNRPLIIAAQDLTDLDFARVIRL